jgi:hypothetical protein
MEAELWGLYLSKKPGRSKILKESFGKIGKKFCTANGCAHRGKLLLLEQFPRNRRGVCGRLPHCKACHNGKQHGKGVAEPTTDALKRRQQAVLSVKEECRHYNRAINQICQISKMLLETKKPLELRQWQDGTRSDIGVRPVGQDDRWLLLQVKGTEREAPPFTWIGCGGYEGMSILCLTANPELVYFFGGEVGITTCNIRVSESNECAYKDAPVAIDELSTELCRRWSIETTYTEDEARMQCSEKSQREYVTIMLDERFHPEATHQWPVQCNATDRLCDGLRVQHKTVYWDSTNGWYKTNLSSRASTEPVPYRVGEVDVFKLSTVHERLRLFVQWTIPATAMDQVFQKLDRQDGVTFGGTGMSLHLLGPDGHNAALHQAVFGNRKPDSRTNLQSSRFVEVHSLPLLYSVPECMRGRDPTVFE